VADEARVANVAEQGNIAFFSDNERALGVAHVQKLGRNRVSNAYQRWQITRIPRLAKLPETMRGLYPSPSFERRFQHEKGREDRNQPAHDGVGDETESACALRGEPGEKLWESQQTDDSIHF
jgi:hypothetical protein